MVNHAGQAWIIYAVTAWEGCVQQFFAPAQQSLLPQLAGDEGLVTANALNGQSNDVARLIGSAVGGGAAAIGGFTLIAVVDIASFLASTVLILGIRGAARARDLAKPAELGQVSRPTWRRRGMRLRAEWSAGLRLCVGPKALRVIVVFLLLTSFGEGIMVTLFAPFVRSVLHAGAGTYGLIVSAQAIGGICGGLVIAAIGDRFRLGLALGWAAIAFGSIDLVIFLYPLAFTAVWPVIVLMVLVGLPGALTLASAMTLLQTQVSEGHRGRVFGALGVVEGAAMVLGTSAAGLLGQSVGIVAMLTVQGGAYIVAGIMAVVVLRQESGQHGRLENLLAPLPESRRARGRRVSLFAVVQALVLRAHHVHHALNERLAHPVTGQRRTQLRQRLALIAHRRPEHLGHDPRQVVGREVLRAEHRHAPDPGPGPVEQQPGSGRGDVAGRGRRRLPVGGGGVGEHALVPDRGHLAQQIVHEGGVRQRPVGHARAGDEVVHGQRRGDQSGLISPRSAPPERRDANHSLDAVPGESLGRRLGETGIGDLDAGRAHIRRNQPEDGVRTGEGPIHNVGISMRPEDDVDPVANPVGEFRGVAHDHPHLFTAGRSALQQVLQHLAANVARGRRDHDHRSILRAVRRGRPIPLDSD